MKRRALFHTNNKFHSHGCGLVLCPMIPGLNSSATFLQMPRTETRRHPNSWRSSARDCKNAYHACDLATLSSLKRKSICGRRVQPQSLESLCPASQA